MVGKEDVDGWNTVETELRVEGKYETDSASSCASSFCVVLAAKR